MKKMTTTTTVNGKTKTISVWLDERTVQALERTHDEKLIRQYIIDEHNVKLIDLKETRRHRSLDADIDNGFDAPDEHCYEEDVFLKIEIERLRSAFAVLTHEQKELVRRVYFDEENQSDIAEEQGVDPTAIRNRLNKIYRKIKKFLK